MKLTRIRGPQLFKIGFQIYTNNITLAISVDLFGENAIRTGTMVNGLIDEGIGWVENSK